MLTSKQLKKLIYHYNTWYQFSSSTMNTWVYEHKNTRYRPIVESNPAILKRIGLLLERKYYFTIIKKVNKWIWAWVPKAQSSKVGN